MLNTTYDTETATFPLWSPEDIRQASEKALNLWVGVLSPYWAPFFAASGFGLGAWAMSRSLIQNEHLADELPLVARWPGFTPLWGQKDFTPEVLEPVVDAAVETGAEVAAKTAETLAESAVAATEEATDAVMDPVAEVPVVPAVAEAIAEPAAEAVVPIAPKPIAPKPIAKALAVAKPEVKVPPKPTTKPAPRAAK